MVIVSWHRPKVFPTGTLHTTLPWKGKHVSSRPPPAPCLEFLGHRCSRPSHLLRPNDGVLSKSPCGILSSHLKYCPFAVYTDLHGGVSKKLTKQIRSQDSSNRKNLLATSPPRPCFPPSANCGVHYEMKTNSLLKGSLIMVLPLHNASRVYFLLSCWKKSCSDFEEVEVGSR